MREILKIIISIICGILFFAVFILLIVIYPFEVAIFFLLSALIIIIGGTYSILFGIHTVHEEFKEPMDLTERDLHIYDYEIECVVCGRSGI